MKKLIIFLSVILTLNGFSQQLSREEVASFKTEGEELISYLQFTLNAIGDNELSPKEKDIIISESFLKMFRDEKVQVEDDLDASRETVTNKDVQAYLKDVDFFFKYANFTFNILSIDVQLNENGKPFLLTNVLRTLQAIDIKGDSIRNDQQRFIEIELDSDKRDLKIASIYTTKLNENEESIRWWNLLPEAWKNILGVRAVVEDSISFSSIIQLNDKYLILPQKNRALFDMQNDSSTHFTQALDSLKAISLYQYDTIWYEDSIHTDLKASVIKGLDKILEITDLNLKGNKDIVDLEPISRLRNLRNLDVSSTQIQDIYPVRNLTKLHSLNCANTFINSIDALTYSMGLTILNLSNTRLSEIEALSNLENLVILDISNTAIDNLGYCQNMHLLEDLKMKNTLITDLKPISNLLSLSYLDISDNEQLQSLEALAPIKKLKVLYCNNTMVNDLSPLASLLNLETLYCENVEITSLSGLEKLPNLKKIYCDNSLLGRQKAIDFMRENPQILVVYESKQLQIWWDELPETWKTIFAEIAEPDAIPTKEQLHQITTIKSINIAGNKSVKSLLPLEKLKNLEQLDASNTAITSLDGIGESREMRKLNLGNTNIQRLYIIESLNLIEELILTNCPVKDIYPLKGLVNLKALSLSNTQIDGLDALNELQNLRFLEANNSSISHQQFEDFIELKEDLLVIYQSEELELWWENLEEAWQDIFNKKMLWTQKPNAKELHRLIQIKELEISENRSISNVTPLEKLKHLRKLKINDTKITNVSSIGNLPYLTEIDLSKNPISDLDALQLLSNLEFIYLNNTPIDNLDWLFGLTKIKVLDISSTEIKNLKALTNVIHLEKLIAYNTKINNIKPIEDLPDLILLKIYNSKVSSKKIDTFRKSHPNCAIDFY